MCSPFFSNFSEIPCVKIGFNVNDFLRMMNLRAVFLNVGDSIFFRLPGLYFYLRGQPFRHTKSKASACEYCS